jgi:hypothetical protein
MRKSRRLTFVKTKNGHLKLCLQKLRWYYKSFTDSEIIQVHLTSDGFINSYLITEKD